MTHQIKKNLGAIVYHDYTEFRVWAPFAKNVTLIMPFLCEGDGRDRPMNSEGDGYWSLRVEDAEVGRNYKYMIDAGSETVFRNDPRGRALTASENGVSVITDTTFEWEDDLFMPIPPNQQVIYEMHIGTFNRRDAATPGTFYDAIEKLDYLSDLGINMIELMPVTSMAHANGWGYNTSDIFSIESSYGGRHGLMEFVKACHQRNIGVTIDVVYNHFLNSDLWRYDGWYENDRGGIYFYNDERGDTPWGSRPDYGRAEVRQFILDNVVMWFNEYRVDGLRLDSTTYMRNTEGRNDDPAHDIGDAWSLMSDITRLAHKIRPGAIVIAEDAASNHYITKPANDGGCGFDAQWGLHFPHAIRNFLGMEAQYYVDICYEIQSKFNGNVFERIIFSDSHDTAANGHVRINEAVTPGNSTSVQARERTLVAAVLTLTSPGIPMLLQGQEFMQEGAFNDWQELEWDKAERHAGIVLAHRNLIDLRLNRFGTTAGLLGQNVAIFHYNDDNRVIGYHRWNSGGIGDDVLVIANCGNGSFESYDLVLPLPGTWRVCFNSSWKGYSQDFKESKTQAVTSDENGRVTIGLPAYSALILSQD